MMDAGWVVLPYRTEVGRLTWLYFDDTLPPQFFLAILSNFDMNSQFPFKKLDRIVNF
jgi:hypothetical protein